MTGVRELTAAGVERELGISRRTLAGLVAAGVIAPVYTPGFKHPTYIEAQLVAYFDEKGRLEARRQAEAAA